MMQPWIDPDAGTLAASANANLEDLFRSMTGLPGSDLSETPQLCRHFAFPGNPMFKGVWGCRLRDAPAAAIAETIEWFRAHDAPFFFWWTGPETRPADLGGQLQAAGLASMEEQQRLFARGIVQKASGGPVMVMDLREADFGLCSRAPAGLVIRPAETESDLLAFRKVFTATYQLPEPLGQAWVDATLAFGIASAPWTIQIGWLDGEAVATNLVYHGAGFVSVYAIATLPEFARRGIGAAVTLAPLKASLEAGWAWASLFATEAGFPVYRRIGFRDTGARVNRYLWRAP
jgi:ribosomal protein S18 acetylase RimI-like enzyme